MLKNVVYFCFFFFFKQKTAYEMRISDWSSDVCSSDLFAEKHVGGILAQQCRGFRRMRRQPGTDGLQRNLVARHITARDQHAADGNVRMPVLRRKADPHLAAVVELPEARALHLQEEGIGCIVEPDQFELAALQRTGLDAAARTEEHTS